MINTSVKRCDEIIAVLGACVPCFYILFLVLYLKSPGALSLGLTCDSFSFLFFIFFVGLSCGRRGKKEELLSGMANLAGGAGIKKNTQEMNEDTKWSG